MAANSALKPGGWVEFQDWDHNIYSDDGSLKDEHSLKKWNVELLKCFASMNREASPGPKLKAWVEDAGFKNITHEVFKAPVGPWAKDKKYARKGHHVKSLFPSADLIFRKILVWQIILMPSKAWKPSLWHPLLVT